MFNNSLDSKEFFTRPDGEIIRDLTQSMFENKNRTYVTYTVYKVPRDYVMRPDLISMSAYNNSLYAEIILKYNGISNPFSIDEGDVILIPDLDSAKDRIKEVGKGTAADAAQRLRNTYKYIDPLKIPKPSEVSKEYNKRQIVQAPDNALPPNFAEEGTSQLTYRNGRAYFGESVETCLKNGLSTGEFLASVIKNKK